MSTSEVNLLEAYREMYQMNNRQITTLHEMQQTILQKINTLTSRIQANVYIYGNETTTPTTRQTQTPTQPEGVRTAAFSNITNALNTECPITYEHFEADTVVSQITACGHVFSSHALSTWLNRHGSCPVCRHQTGARRPRSALSTFTENILTRILDDFSSNILDSSGLDGVTFLR